MISYWLHLADGRIGLLHGLTIHGFILLRLSFLTPVGTMYCCFFLYIFSTENIKQQHPSTLWMLAEQPFTDQHDVTHPRSWWHNYNAFLHLRKWRGSNNKPPANYPWPRNCARCRDCTKNVSAFVICDATTIEANRPTTWTARNNENRYLNHCCKT